MAYEYDSYGNMTSREDENQGNVRAVLDHNATLVERNQYYPYGGLINPPAIASTLQIQPYKYSSKELDRENGLDLYDSQARWYDPMLPQTTTQDPLAEKYYSLSPYTWCAGNPVILIDKDGQEPGDPFTSMDAAARDFARLYNGQSIKRNKEIATYIYADIKDGKIIYSYIVPTQADAHGIVANELAIPLTSVTVGYAHTHGAYNTQYKENEFSGTKDGNTNADNKKVKNGDLGVFNRDRIMGFLSSSNGTLQKYNPSTGNISIIATDLPSDPNDRTRKNNIPPVDLNSPTVSKTSFVDALLILLKKIVF